MDMDDLVLWKKFLSGDDKAYAYFYKRYVEELFSYGMRFTLNRELVKDCIQEVFIKIYSNRSNLGYTDNVKLYLFMALKNTIFNVFQKNKSFYHIDTVEPVFCVEFSVEDKWIERELEQEQKEKVSYMMDTLTPRQKEVIYYRYVKGMRIKEISKLMDMNYQSVQNLIQRSMKKIRNAFPVKDRSALSINFKSGCL